MGVSQTRAAHHTSHGNDPVPASLTLGLQLISLVLQIAEQRWLSSKARDSDMENLLQHIYWQFILLYGPLRPLLVIKTALDKCIRDQVQQISCTAGVQPHGSQGQTTHWP